MLQYLTLAVVNKSSTVSSIGRNWQTVAEAGMAILYGSGSRSCQTAVLVVVMALLHGSSGRRYQTAVSAVGIAFLYGGSVIG